MKKTKPVIEYERHVLLFGGHRNIELYLDGKVNIAVKEDGSSSLETKELKILPEKVKSYANRLVKEGFFDFEDRYKPFLSVVMDGWHDSTTLNYQGKSKTVKFENGYPSREFGQIVSEIVSELEELVE